MFWLFNEREIKKNPSSSCIVDLYKHLGIFKNTREAREALAYGWCFCKHLSRDLKVTACLLLGPFFIRFIIFIQEIQSAITWNRPDLIVISE